MSISIVPLILTRIKAAMPKSPIAVFRLSAPVRGQLDAVFGSTVSTHRSVEREDPLFVGYFHKGMDARTVADKLHAAAQG